MTSGSSEQVRHPVFARIYMRMSRKRHETEDEHRRYLLEGLSGRVIEVGAGNGLNFSLYPKSVDQGWARSMSASENVLRALATVGLAMEVSRASPRLVVLRPASMPIGGA